MTLDPVPRLVEQTFRFRTDPDAVIAWLTTLGCRCVPQESGSSWTIHGTAGGTCSLSRGLDPIAIASSLGFAVAGQWWPQVFPTLITAVSHTWKTVPAVRP